ncbi:hypothetical protein, partial [uncultured Capnocytophaga sp.]|uniref:hypothetical protein n=1 Tax=uncultured Capnocytophaga sp. TaxID=159273 RepID=UPI002596B312
EKYIDKNGKEQKRDIQLYDDTTECNRHIRNLRDAFVKYVKDLPIKKREKIADIYNKRFNNTAKPIDINYSFFSLDYRTISQVVKCFRRLSVLPKNTLTK